MNYNNVSIDFDGSARVYELRIDGEWMGAFDTHGEAVERARCLRATSQLIADRNAAIDASYRRAR
ncbi:MAG: hypothetical protein ACRYGR_08615 [Janthinobacterium lividum]